MKVVVSSVGVHEGERWMRSVRRPHEWDSFQKTVMAAARKRVTTGEPTTMPLPEIMLCDPHTLKVIQENHQKHDDYVKDYDLQSAEACWRYKPEWVADRIAPRPVMFITIRERFPRARCKSKSLLRKGIGEPKDRQSSPARSINESYYFCSPEHHEIGMVEAV